MGVKFDLTIVANEIFDSVIVMEKSPAYAAFKEEIEKILSDFNKTGKYWEASTVDVKQLADGSADAMLNMQKAFLLWTIKEEREDGKVEESSYEAFVKLFFKSQESQLIFLNEGKKTIMDNQIAALKTKYLRVINTTPDLFNSLKDFFSGYVYGYFFNYLSEQKIMKEYAEFIVCLALMSGKIKASESAKQKILPKMAKLLNNDRFQYISGFIPLPIMINIVCDRFEMGNITEMEMAKVARSVTDYMTANYELNDSDDQKLISDNVTASIMSGLNSEHIDVTEFSAEVYKKTLSGNRTFLDSDHEDFGDYTVEKFTEIIETKCNENSDPFYQSGRDVIIDLSLGSDNKGFKYPLVYKDDNKYWCSKLYEQLIYPVVDDILYEKLELTDIPLSEFIFVMNELKTNIIRKVGSLTTMGYSVRIDKKHLIQELNKIDKSKSLSDAEKKMNKLEIALSIASGNMNAEEYKKMLIDNVFGTDLYEEYIRFRMDKIFQSGMKSLDAKKNLLDELNNIVK